MDIPELRWLCTLICLPKGIGSSMPAVKFEPANEALIRYWVICNK